MYSLLPVIYQLSNLARCHVFVSQRRQQNVWQTEKKQRRENLTAVPHSIHLSSSPKHPFIHFHMTTAMGTRRNGFTSEPELFIIISLSVCTIIYVLQLWRSSVKGPNSRRNTKSLWISKTELSSSAGST